jgi:hypothetical protein
MAREHESRASFALHETLELLKELQAVNRRLK